MIKSFWRSKEESSEISQPYITNFNSGGWRDTRRDYCPEFTGSMSSLMDSTTCYDFTNTRCEFMIPSSTEIQRPAGFPPFDLRSPQPPKPKPYGHRKPPNQLGWLEWIYLVLTV